MYLQGQGAIGLDPRMTEQIPRDPGGKAEFIKNVGWSLFPGFELVHSSFQQNNQEDWPFKASNSFVALSW